MKKLVIIGASAMGREAYTYANESGIEVKGFLDSRSSILTGFTNYPPVLGAVENYKIADDDMFVVAIGDPTMKMKYVDMILKRGGEFTSIVHPSSYVGHNVKIGIGSIICPNVYITNDTILGSHVIVNIGASINHDNFIGDGCTISPGCRLAGRVKLGSNVFIGVGALLIPDVTLGDGVFVAAGAVVTKTFMSGRIMGVPATAK